MSTTSATLRDLAAAVPNLDPQLVGENVLVADIHHDSRSVNRGDGFVAVVGSRADGHDFAADAVARGASAVVAERDLGIAVPQLLVADCRRALPWLAATVHSHPSQRLTVIGVTGTNGKTTVTHMIESIVATSGRSAGVVGTVGARIDGLAMPLARTTPEASDLQRLLHRMVDVGIDVVAVEVSSHALALRRVDAVRFAVAAFTNLSQDHLDFHGDMAGYEAAKASLFTPERISRAVIWTDDPAGARIAGRTSVATTTVGFSDGDVRGEVLETTPDRTLVAVSGLHGELTLEVRVAGEFNAANALVAVTTALELGIDPRHVEEGVAALDAIPGRFELVGGGHPFPVFVDYAHTPAAIASVVDAGGAMTTGQVIVVVGAGGDRDAAKRPAMGEAASRADVVVVTSDNPRSENPEEIIAEVARGAVTADMHLVTDRRAAIEFAISMAQPGDLVLILGKGHEQGQEIAGRVLPFDDRDVAARALEELGSRP